MARGVDVDDAFSFLTWADLVADEVVEALGPPPPFFVIWFDFILCEAECDDAKLVVLSVLQRLKITTSLTSAMIF